MFIFSHSGKECDGVASLANQTLSLQSTSVILINRKTETRIWLVIRGLLVHVPGMTKVLAHELNERESLFSESPSI